MLTIQNFSAGRLDRNDWSRRAELNAVLENQLEAKVHLVRHSVLLSTGDGLAIAGESDDRHCSLASGGELKINAEIYADCRGIAPGADLSATMFVNLYRRERLVFEEALVPEDSTESFVARSKSPIDALAPNASVVVTKTDPDDDGDFHVKVKCGVINRSSEYLKGVLLLANFVDEDGMTIESDETELDIAPGASALLDTYLYRRNASVHGVKVRAAVSVFRQIGTAQTEAVLSQVQDADEDEYDEDDD